MPAAQREDVAQEIWIQVHRLIHRLREDASERAWLVAIARKRVLQHHRTQSRRERRERSWSQAASEGTDGDRGRVEAKSMVARMLDRMNEEQRLAFVLVHGYGLTGEEVAAAVGDSVNTVYSRLRLARRHVRRVADAAQVEERRVARTLWSQPPSRRTERRVWAGLLLQLEIGSGLLGASLGGVGSAPVAMTLGIAVVGLVAVRGVIAPADPSSPSPPIVTEQDTGPHVTPPPSPVLEAPRMSASAAIAPAASPRPVRSAPARRPARARAREASRPLTLAAEAALLKDAKQALDRNAPADALALLDEHARRFPDGALEDVRQGARIRALCAMGRVRQARGEAQVLASTHGGSVVARGVEDVCEQEPPA